VFIGTDQNERIKVGTLTPGKFFGEMSLFTGQKRQATVVADTESLTLEISKEEIKNILKNKPELVNDFGELIAEREAINQKMLDQFNHRKESFVKKMVENIRVFFNIK
jgi:CRP-like cAMP-binding protein